MSAHEPGDPTADLVVAWSSIIRKVSPANRAWLTNSRPVTMHTSTAMIAVHNEFTRDRIETKMRSELEELLSDHFRRPIHLAITIDPDIELALGAPDSSPQEAEEELPPAEFVPKVNPGDPDALPYRPQSADERLAGEANGLMRLNPKYTFDTFVIGASNRFAHAAAVAVAESPGKSYNPLLIYGGSGLGKTHLLHAIGHYVVNYYDKVKVRYVSTEELTNDFINAIGTNTANDFRRAYRDVDVLLVDDIQFLENKIQTQEEFFHTFNTLHNAQKQIVMTSDRPPKLLEALEPRLRSRFEWGLLTDIQPPDLETRIAILRRKVASERLSVSPDVLEFIASRIQTNIRELEGALIRVTAFASLNRQPVDMSLAEVVLRDLIPDGQEAPVTVDRIITVTAGYFGITRDDLMGTSRTQTVVTARQIAMYLCRELTDLSLPKIGAEFGGKDHTTVMHADRKIRSLMGEKRQIFNQVSELTNRIKQN
ncbi:chromosomal replication initiator protein DnaA [Acidipropionibacterium jensenii]|uniref:chromosomal replication initiator protein DnaA n=1 Tax=Acidipropionibacterium jensenii TaxID=1749 RepID=UPI00110BB81F|nr:chromosomal replication initiator protein DnaA [Acidipropionibacterium jensenii]MDN5977913.1 chromosomal replication initiator protein DnaA [Acidipropionibacterium jensenii]MDN5996690.1 chromosomal replication initiator protein DnaA [Acidipropionibacterium jensenii]MDN6425961.1 chromosomal replication initiator protein DnaA [Acidipropionibacterium jensenii]MDN6441623.1 chromosomal replication initiator protein DnaA [Acidipropionibacterium jensenii]MDN6480826.1 chromosomal replication initia